MINSEWHNNSEPIVEPYIVNNLSLVNDIVMTKKYLICEYWLFWKESGYKIRFVVEARSWYKYLLQDWLYSKD